MENIDKKNIYIDEETGKDIRYILEGKRIHADKKVEKLTKTRGGKYYGDLPQDTSFELDWNLAGFWYAFGPSYMDALGKTFKVYLFKNSGRRYLYEVIPTKEMKILNVDEPTELSYNEVLKEYDGAENDLGCIWNLEKGFILRPLYFCTGHECVNKEKNIWKFTFRKLNKPDLVF